MIRIPKAFASSYAKARVKFLEAAATAGTHIESFNHPLPGREGEQLALDVALDGDPQAKRLLIVSSGCHGVEGFCGSGVQVFALHDSEWREKARSAGIAVLYLHALNPYGFSHLRRVTQENVDLNRNFLDFSKPVPDNADYGRIHPLLLPETWPPDDANRAATQAFIDQNGVKAWQAAISAGQYEFSGGLFYGGNAPTWSNHTLRQVLSRYVNHANQIAWIDLHTGLGPQGVGERIHAGRDNAEALARARHWWGDGVTSIHDGSSSSALLTGLLWYSIEEAAPNAQYTGIALEYGTEPVVEILDALRGDHWLALHPEAPAELAAQIKERIRHAFYTDTDPWKGQVISQARQAMFQSFGE
ncbi:M14 family metallopeptidase [Ottowia thiooxydans]|uniref:M14 family metallopeptidase n=1 Tax=Ottowia thiooxydans TaxID=219182 RepID=UPI0003FAB7A7|nr:M14 family metallopeptidase [Ottowia thiooxydans]